MKKLNVCVVGAGYMGVIHTRVWQALPETEVISIVDIKPDLAQSVAAEFNISSWTTDYKEAVAIEEIDIVSVCVPTYLHPEVTILAARHGKHVLCEKPIALTLDSAREMLQVVEESGVKLMIGLMRRFSPVMTTLRDFLDQEREPVIYRAETALEMRPKRAMHDQQANGGPYIDMLCHFIDTWRVIFQSEPVRVMAQGLTFAQQRPEIDYITNKAIDSGSFSVEFASGDIGCGFVTWGLPPGIDHGFTLREALYGPHGVVDVQFVKKQHLVWHQENGGTQTLLETEVNNYDLEIAAFVDSILHDKPIISKGEDGLKSLQVSLSLLKSIELREAVSL